MSYSLDTNVILRLMLGDMPEQARQIEDLLQTARPGTFEVADAVLFECVWVLTGPLYRFDRELIGDLLLRLMEIPQLNCNRELVRAAVPLFLRHKAISFIDACLATYAELDEAAPLLTYDKKLAKALPKLVKALP